jgi:hypothetical protein
MPVAALVALLFWTAPASCTRDGELPDRSCTPGAVSTTDLGVICQTSTRSRRHVSESVRRSVLASYGVRRADAGGYELDHLVPLELGGSNDATNLWPEPFDEARRKDVEEDRAHGLVCSHRATIEHEQLRFREDWRKP